MRGMADGMEWHVKPGIHRRSGGREASLEGFETNVDMKSIGLPEAYAETPI
jgi:hypothetical protein